MLVMASLAVCLLFILAVPIETIWFDSLNNLKSSVPAKVQTQSVYELLTRLLPGNQHNQFVLNVDPSLNNENETVIIEKGPDENSIKITGTSGVAVAYGVHSYLKSCCNVHISWDGNQLSLPTVLPQPESRSVLTSVGRFRFFANVCTFSYSFVWWDWDKWEKHLDWLALNGINLPLAHVGQEAIWLQVFLKMGLTRQEVDEFMTGPAYLAWHRMGNLKKWGGPLSDAWHQKRLVLQKQILTRMIQLGMTPVLPAFAGHVPDAMKKRYPNASISALGGWGGLNCTWSCVNLVEPTDPLFHKIGATFMTEMNNTFGLYHAYGADPFNEMAPKSFEPSYVHSIGKSIYDAMAAVDDKAVWVMQAWMFVGTGEWRKEEVCKALARSAPPGNLLFLDLYTDQIPIYPVTNSFQGQPFIWCVLSNFGGRQQLFGTVGRTNEGLYKAVNFPNSTIVGTGLTMEGIDQNYPMYEMALDLSWSSKGRPLNAIEWVREMTVRRYGKRNEIIQLAWEILWNSIYNCTGHDYNCYDRDDDVPAITRYPYLLDKPGFTYYYKPIDVCMAWKCFIEESDKFRDSDLFKRDLIDVTRQVLQIVGNLYAQQISQAYFTQQIDQVFLFGSKMFDLLTDLDKALSTDSHFLLGVWTERAKQWANSSRERAQFEFNARTLLTLWGPSTGGPGDYARKQWAGLISDYYRPRWAVFVAALIKSLATNTTFPGGQYNKDLLKYVEEPFGKGQKEYPNKPVQDPIEIAQKLFLVYYDTCKTIKRAPEKMYNLLMKELSSIYRGRLIVP